MFRNGLMIIFAAFMSMSLISCSSNEKKVEETPTTTSAGDVTEDSNVSEKSVTFNPEGSDSGSISGLTTVNFEYDQSSLTAATRDALTKNAEWIKSHPEANVQIEGHCDEAGSVEYNLSLGDRRAQAVKRFLVNLGVDSKRLSVISYGEEKPVETGDSAAAHAANRRANFLPIPR